MKNKIIKFTSIIAALIILVFVFYYLNTNYGVGLVCVFHKITGLYCAGCGMTRGVLSLIKLDFYQAFRYNIFSLILFPVLVVYFLAWVYSKVFNKSNFMDNKIPAFIWIIFIIALLLYGVLRNIPQFSYLSPTVI